MRLQLNTSVSNTSDTAPAAAADSSSPRGTARGGDSSGYRDSISVSGASSALNALAVDRSARIEQLTAAVQTGQYRVTSAAIGSAVVGQSLASGG